MKIQIPEATLIATLGSEPQVITAVLDLLNYQGVKIQKLIIIQTVSSDSRMIDSVAILKNDIADWKTKAGASAAFVEIKDDYQNSLADIESPEAIKAGFRTIYRLIQTEKQAGRQVHLSISGGRKPLALFGMVAAQMLFDEDDHFWYLISGGEFLASKRLHPEKGDNAGLIEVPVILWNRVSPGFENFNHRSDPFIVLEQIQNLQLVERINRSAIFIESVLTKGEQRVVECLVKEGLTDQGLAERLNLSPRTVEQHLRSAYGKASDFWGIESITRGQLISLLNLYYSTRIREIPDVSL